MHDKNCELYSASAENIQEMLKESKLLFENELNGDTETSLEWIFCVTLRVTKFFQVSK